MLSFIFGRSSTSPLHVDGWTQLITHVPNPEGCGVYCTADLGNDGRAPSNGPFAKYKWSKQALLGLSAKGRQSVEGKPAGPS